MDTNELFCISVFSNNKLFFSVLFNELFCFSVFSNNKFCISVFSKELFCISIFSNKLFCIYVFSDINFFLTRQRMKRLVTLKVATVWVVVAAAGLVVMLLLRYPNTGPALAVFSSSGGLKAVRSTSQNRALNALTQSSGPVVIPAQKEQQVRLCLGPF